MNHTNPSSSSLLTSPAAIKSRHDAESQLECLLVHSGSPFTGTWVTVEVINQILVDIWNRYSLDLRETLKITQTDANLIFIIVQISNQRTISIGILFSHSSTWPHPLNDHVGTRTVKFVFEGPSCGFDFYDLFQI